MTTRTKILIISVFLAVLSTMTLPGNVAFGAGAARAGMLPSGDLMPVAAVRPAPADDDTLLVRFRPEAAGRRSASLLGGLGARVERALTGTGFVLVSTGGRPASEVAAALVASGAAEIVEPNRTRTAASVPNDPFYRQQQEDFAAVRLPRAWDRTVGSDDLVVAVIDSGVDLDHSEFAGRLVRGRDFVNGDSDPSDDNGHGTMVAGIIAAQAENHQGIAGAAWRARIMPVKVLNRDGWGYDSDIADAIAWAADHGADVINLSIGGSGGSRAMQSAVDHARRRGAVVVAAAGNEGSSERSYPGACSGVIAVAATHGGGDVASFSNYGSWIDLAAPGVRVFTTAAGGRYTSGTGTSFASPIVAGAALLVLAADPSIGPGEVDEVLADTAQDRGDPGFDPDYGAGLLDAGAAVGAVAPDDPEDSTPDDPPADDQPAPDGPARQDPAPQNPDDPAPDGPPPGRVPWPWASDPLRNLLGSPPPQPAAR